MVYPKSLQRLIDNLKILPSVGNKTAERYALKILELNEEEILELSEAIMLANKNIIHCHKCGNLSEEKYCEICTNENRDQSLICVVANITDVIAMEKQKTIMAYIMF